MLKSYLNSDLAYRANYKAAEIKVGTTGDLVVLPEILPTPVCDHFSRMASASPTILRQGLNIRHYNIHLVFTDVTITLLFKNHSTSQSKLAL